MNNSVIFGIIIICLIIWIYYVYIAHPPYNHLEYNHIKHTCKTGDIILFHALDNINPIFIGSYYGHIGIVYIDPEDPDKIPYIFEAFNPVTMPFYPEMYSHGIAVSELEHRLNSYRGYCFYKELVNPIDIEIQKKFKHFMQYAMENMYYNTSIISNGVNKLLFNEELHHGTNCAELVYLSLIKLGILDIKQIEYNRKHHLLWLANTTEFDNNYYYDPIYILSNYFKV